jgi:hypothetical protein
MAKLKLLFLFLFLILTNQSFIEKLIKKTEANPFVKIGLITTCIGIHEILKSNYKEYAKKFALPV